MDSYTLEKDNTEERKFPAVSEIEQELSRVRYKKRFSSVLRSTAFTLLIVAAIAVLIATMWTPVLRIYGKSMSPTLSDGSIIVSVRTSKFNTGDIIAFYYNNKILVKRVIASEGDWVDIDEDGNVYVNNKMLDEPYLDQKALGQCNIELPYQVPDGRLFVMGDNREVSVDSRNTAVGCVAQEQLVGKLIFVVWPLDIFGRIS